MRKAIFLGALLLAPMTWGSLIGTSVTGSLTFLGLPTNYYDPANGLVPAAGYLNSSSNFNSPTVTVAEPAIEFGLVVGANADVTNITASQILFSDTVTISGGDSSIELIFTDAAFASVALSSNDFPGMTYGIAGSAITIDLPSHAVTDGQVFTAVFNVGSGVAAPEPSTFPLIGVVAATLFAVEE